MGEMLSLTELCVVSDLDRLNAQENKHGLESRGRKLETGQRQGQGEVASHLPRYKEPGSLGTAEVCALGANSSTRPIASSRLGNLTGFCPSVSSIHAPL